MIFAVRFLLLIPLQILHWYIPPTPDIPLSTECCRVTSVNIYTDILYIQYVYICMCMYHIQCTICVNKRLQYDSTLK
jgi:hypothetical protein